MWPGGSTDLTLWGLPAEAGSLGPLKGSREAQRRSKDQSRTPQTVQDQVGGNLEGAEDPTEEPLQDPRLMLVGLQHRW